VIVEQNECYDIDNKILKLYDKEKLKIKTYQCLNKILPPLVPVCKDYQIFRHTFFMQIQLNVLSFSNSTNPPISILILPLHHMCLTIIIIILLLLNILDICNIFHKL
jgi:hypothetical protein